MYIRSKSRYKDGVHHRYFSIVESVRLSSGNSVQRQVLYLGEINNSQKAAWTRAIEAITGKTESRQMALFPDDRKVPDLPSRVSGSVWTIWNCIVHANGVPAGWTS